MVEIDVATEIRRLADEIRAVADGGLRYADDLPYDAARYRHFRRIGAELMSLVDERDVYAALKHDLAEELRADRHGYVEAKGPFIWETMRMADEWAQQIGWEPGPTDA